MKLPAPSMSASPQSSVTSGSSAREEKLSPGKAPGRRPKIDERARKLLEEDLKDRPFVTLQERCDYLQAVAGLEVSRSVVCRTIKRMESTRKKGWQLPVNEMSG